MLNQLKRMSVTLFATLMLLTSAFAGIGSVDQIAVPVENTSESNIVLAFAEEMPRKKKASRKGKRRNKKRQKSLTGGEDIEKPKGEKGSLKEKNKGGKKSTSWWKKLFSKKAATK